ncbi:MAG: transcriptional repressor NrdR [Myxococcales bacterium]|nr:transcriptional repressor NrdR [Myxococcales bacterium]MCB9519291.1 transcriptional repressor NrdR [Myxococcales bacterium]MCB9530735.1 transcriptional repressor NrdR [Myxococcales bacterium]MCB9533371.1 transcriptional repressor NrdR [Myxococcales bacterium]
MRCPRCGHLDDRVVDSRQSRDGDAIRRRRECLECGARFTTYESIELSLPLVVKRDGRREPFDPGKLRRALRTACQKRPVTAEQIDATVRSVERAVASVDTGEIETRTIGDLVVDALRELDGVAYVRFASVYYAFTDPAEFVAAVDRAREQRS